ncbi:potassium transporter 5-like isoform X1 [Gossypium arboreum]|uniref:potassium transporter 5-like isoform X1 n=1 Tax=Gossypium arboreum TaxID=29729 RepID=UPI0022F1469C|nr:potassium transporter 5-like isoform X1 [Gossypium arboreum]
MGTPVEFEQQLVEKLKEFIRHEYFIAEGEAVAVENPPQSSNILINQGKDKGSSRRVVFVEETLNQLNQSCRSSASIQSFNEAKSNNSLSGIVSAAPPILVAEEEIQFVQKVKDEGIIYLLGEAEVIAKSDSSYTKRMIVDYGYNFLRRNFRQGEKVMMIPQTRLLRVGMTYEI